MVKESFVFGVDLDGVCANYTAGFREVVAADRGIDSSELPIGRTWGFEEWDLDEAKAYHLVLSKEMNAEVELMKKFDGQFVADPVRTSAAVA